MVFRGFDAESLCRQIAARELAGSPLYIVPQSVLPADLGGKSLCYGYTCPSLDLYVREQIGAAWRGRGACMVVNDADLLADTDPLDFEHAFLAVVIHELAHIVERPTLFYPRETESPLRIKYEALCVASSVSTEPAPEVAEQSPPFTGHDARFIRTAVHLLHRADLAGTHIAPAPVCAGDNYCLKEDISPLMPKGFVLDG